MDFNRIKSSDSLTVEKNVKVKPKSKALKVLSIVLAVIGGAVAVIGVFFLAYYLATLGKVTNGDFCMSDLSCLTNSNMTCKNGKCSCPNGTTWNSPYCSNTSIGVTFTNITSNSTNTTLPLNRTLSMFSGASYTTNSISSYGSYTIINPLDLTVIYTTEMFYVVAEWSNNQLVFFDEKLNFRKVISTVGIQYVEYYNGYFYVTCDQSFGYVYKIDFNSVWNASYYVGATNLYGATYNAQSDYVYVCDYPGGMIRAFDKNLNYNSSQSWSLSSVFGIASYQGYLYIVTQTSLLYIYQGTTQKTSYSNVCKSVNAFDIFVHSDSGYMLISCYNDKMIVLWYTNGSQAFFTGLFIKTAGNPRASAMDSSGRIITVTQNPSRVDIYS